MSDYHNFTSLAPHEEAQFVVFERRTQESLQKAFMIGLIASLAFGLLAVGVYFGVAPRRDDTARDMDMTQLKSKKDAAPKPPAAEKP
jgi:hypothetical protein